MAKLQEVKAVPTFGLQKLF